MALRQLVMREGSKNWDTMAKRLGSSRTSSSLRTRWSTIRSQPVRRVGAPEKLENREQDTEAGIVGKPAVNVTAPAVQKSTKKQPPASDYPCDTCGKRFASRMSLGGHRRHGCAARAASGAAAAQAAIHAAAAAAAAGGGGSAWTEEEDEALRVMVAQDGVGNWAEKRVRLGAHRSESSMRYRWHHLSTNGTTAPASSVRAGMSHGIQPPSNIFCLLS